MREGDGAVRERTGGAVRASWIDVLLGTRPLRGLALAALAGVFMAAVGAFGTGDAPLLLRLGYWVTVLVIGALGGVAVSMLVDRGGWFDAQPALQGGLIVVALTLPLTGVIWGVTCLVFGSGPMRLAQLWSFAGPVFIVTCVMTALNYATQRTPPETHAGPAGSQPARFLARLPARLRGASLHAVQAEDHYLRLHTSKGQDLILMRLSDAVAELEGLEGAQVHRSWWVARDAVEDSRRGDGRAVLTLTGGVQVPVSRAYAKALRAGGWL
ncbi:MAG: LytTR family DNA-binding domain-containing protein [Caulobacter sp.]|nr:LytTR family DNA-binding domain-containing protein [Caulobacter sp.]